MAIYKSKHASNFTVIPNDVFLHCLSVEALGLLLYLLHLPQDWVIYKTQLHVKLDLGREKLDRIFKELQECGYIISIEKRTAGKIEYEHIVYDIPFNGEPQTDKPLTVKPHTVKPSTANQPLQSTNIQSTNNTKETISKREKFISLISDTIKEENKQMLDDFIGYWCELNQKGKARFEGEPYFDVSRRFITWKKNAAKYLVNQPVNTITRKSNPLIK